MYKTKVEALTFTRKLSPYLLAYRKLICLHRRLCRLYFLQITLYFVIHKAMDSFIYFELDQEKVNYYR